MIPSAVRLEAEERDLSGARATRVGVGDGSDGRMEAMSGGWVEIVERMAKVLVLLVSAVMLVVDGRQERVGSVGSLRRGGGWSGLQ